MATGLLLEHTIITILPSHKKVPLAASVFGDRHKFVARPFLDPANVSFQWPPDCPCLTILAELLALQRIPSSQFIVI
jgi:hypothetical protein